MEYLKNLNATSANLNKEIAYHEVSAEMIFNSVLGITEEIINSNYFDERSDQNGSSHQHVKPPTILEIQINPQPTLIDLKHSVTIHGILKPSVKTN